MQDLDLVPIMNLVTILIPFLLIGAQFMRIAVIDTALPSPPAATTEAAPDDGLRLTVAITSEGYTVTGRDELLAGSGRPIECTVAGCPDANAYDTAALTRLLATLKGRWPDEKYVVIVPESEVNYETLVRTMDAAREDREGAIGRVKAVLFPAVVIAGAGA
jgi:biopolymer transport protein ExbD